MTPKLFASFALFIAAAAGGTFARSQQTRQVGEFVAQVPDNQTPRTPAAKPGTPTGHRRLFYQYHVSIASRLLPTDKVIEVPLGLTGFDGHRDPERELDQLTAIFAAVAVITVRDRQSAWTDTGDWILTTLTADVQEVLKDTTGKLVAGNLVPITESGGEMIVGPTRVVAFVPTVHPIEIGRTYLAFLTAQNGLMISHANSFEITGDAIKRLRTDAQAEWTLDRQPLGWVKAQVRARGKR